MPWRLRGEIKNVRQRPSMEAYRYCPGKHKNELIHIETQKVCVYSVLMSETVVYIDGGSRGNPSAAGIGVIIEHPTGHRVEISERIGASDNNYAEYAALLVALRYAAANECRQ